MDKPREPLNAAPPHRALTEFYRSPENRFGFVRELFDETAPSYDFLSQALSFGTDRTYRKNALRNAGLRPGMRLLDVASGTGLVIRAALALGLDRKEIAGLDSSRGMLNENLAHYGGPLIQARAERIPLKSECFDFITMGYALRHVEDLVALFREYHRLLRPGGKVLILELSRPESRIGLALMRIYMRSLVPILLRCGTCLPRTGELMKYYWATIEECVPRETILRALDAAGFAKPILRKTGPVLSDFVGERRAGGE